MNCHIQCFVFFNAIFLMFSPYTFAPWKKKPEAPAENTWGTCIDWLYYHGFKDNNAINKVLAEERARQYDEDVSYFAAGYAYFITNKSQLYNINELGPFQFCDKHTLRDVNYPYITLKNAEFTCEGWIDFYLHTKDRNNDEINFIWAKNREKFMDRVISVWAALFFQHITSYAIYKKPRAYCNVMDKSVMNVPLPDKYPFMTLNGSIMSCIEWNIVSQRPNMEYNVLAEKQSKNVTKLPFATIGPKRTCTEWITLCGFSDDCALNYHLVLSMTVNGNKVNSLAKDYTKHVIQRHTWFYERQKELNNQLQQNLLSDLLEDLHAQILNPGNVVETLMTPKEYCESMHFSATELLDYVGRS